MSKEQIDTKNCKECLHFEACCKWTDFPKQIGFPTCRRFTPTYTTLHQPCESVQVEEMAEMLDIIAKARDEYANDITDHTENEYIREGLLDAGYRKQEWISVEERLPEVGTKVVGYDYESNVRCYFITEGRWWIDDGWNTANGWGITHWMPLPEPPKGGEG